MSMPSQKVEIGFDILDSGGPYFTLNDPVKGALDNTGFTLGGIFFFDVTSKVRSIAISRGKNRELDQYDQGLANVVFDNNDRTFDPEYTLSPYFGQIIPKRQIRISSGEEVQFFGLVDDWNLSYEPDGDSVAAAACSDATALFASQTIATRTNSVQTSGQRVNTILDLPEISWPATLRDIDAGQMQLGADTIADNTNALSYFRLIERSEPGAFFIGKAGQVVFRDRLASGTTGSVLLSDDGTGIRYQSLKVQYGSELLANEIVLSSAITSTEVSAIDQASIDEYGIFNLTQTDLLINSNSVLQQLADFYSLKYSTPDYRIESVEILLDELTVAQQSQLLDLELGDVLEVRFTPNKIPPAIDKFVQVIRIDHSVDLNSHILQLGFASVDFAFLVLDDPAFGKLDAGNALAF